MSSPTQDSSEINNQIEYEEILDEEIQNDETAIIEPLHEIEIESDNKEEQQISIANVEIKEKAVKEITSKIKSPPLPSTSSLTQPKSQATIVPPLRPLNIAPKPPEQIPIALKSVHGQSVILLPAGTNPGQTIKILNQQGQEINLANYSISQPMTIKTSPKTKPAACVSTVTSVAQSKPIFIKKIGGATTSVAAAQKSPTKPVTIAKTGGQQLLVIQKSAGTDQQIKLIQANGATVATTVTAAAASTGNNGGVSSFQGKALTLQQAQEMGLISNAKIIHTAGQQQQLSNKRTVLINKTPQKTAVVKNVSQINTAAAGAAATVSTVTTTVTPAAGTSTATTTAIKANSSTKTITQTKPPTKILPAAVSSSSSSGAVAKSTAGQKIILKNASGQVLPAGQYIQVTSAQGLAAGGQIHQINVPGKGVQYIRFVSSTTTATESTNTTSTVKTTGTTASASDTKTTSVTTKIISKSSPATSSSKPAQLIMVPAGYIATNSNISKVPKVPIPSMKSYSKLNSASRPVPIVPAPTPGSTTESATSTTTSTTTATSSSQNASTDASNNNNSTTTTSTTNGIRPRKPCNCTKSQCLKLYCDCFANGEFCYLCNCMNCFNNLDNEVIRNLSIKSCLDRNPNAFRPKIGKAKDTIGGDVLRKHTKGCNCKRSGCLKNYCECYEAKISCSNNCKCIGCKNVEDILEKKAFEASRHRLSDEFLAQKFCRRLLPANRDGDPIRARKLSNSRKQTIDFITNDVIEATCQCLLTISDDGYSNMQNEELTKRQIIEEFGGCLTEIIHCSLNRNNL